MGFKILAINPGSTSTKVALYDEERPLLDLTLRHSAEELARYPHIIDQLEWRREMILSALSDSKFNIKELSTVIGRGGLIHPIPAGVYEVNEAMKHDLRFAKREHASNLGGLLADEIAKEVGVKAYIADPVVVDELDEVARISGLPECPNRSIFHALNQKAIARLHCEKTGIVYEKANLIWVTWAEESRSQLTGKDVPSMSITRSTATDPSRPNAPEVFRPARWPTSVFRGAIPGRTSKKCWQERAVWWRIWERTR